MNAQRTEYLLSEIRSLPREERLRLVERVVHELAEIEARPVRSPVGLFADEPELMEQVIDDAMAARERDPLRRA